MFHTIMFLRAQRVSDYDEVIAR